jgi:hypothetical protein
VTGFNVLTKTITLETASAGGILTPQCPAGQIAVAAGFDPAIDSPPQPVGMDGLWPLAALDYRAWIVQFINTDDHDHEATLYTICSLG